MYAHLAENLDDTKEFDRELEMPFDWELTPMELKREEARRIALRIGAIDGTQDAVAAMRMRQA